MKVSLRLGSYGLGRQPMLVTATLRTTLSFQYESACTISQTRRSDTRWKSWRVCLALPQRKNRQEKARAKWIARLGGLMTLSAMRLASSYPMSHRSEDSNLFGAGSPRSIVSTRFDLE